MLDGEENIIKSAVKGEASAFGLLYDYYQPKIYRFVLVKVSRREEAEDLTHQVFLRAWQNIATYRDIGFPFSSWLYHIARNRVIDHYRTSRPSVSIDEVDPEIFASPEESVASTERSLTLDRVRAAIRALKPDHQDVIVLRFVEDLPLKNVALIIGKSEGAVKLIQHRAIRELKRLLELPED